MTTAVSWNFGKTTLMLGNFYLRDKRANRWYNARKRKHEQTVYLYRVVNIYFAKSLRGERKLHLISFFDKSYFSRLFSCLSFFFFKFFIKAARLDPTTYALIRTIGKLCDVQSGLVDEGNTHEKLLLRNHHENHVWFPEKTATERSEKMWPLLGRELRRCSLKRDNRT